LTPSSFDVQRSLRRFKPLKQSGRLQPRPRSHLEFIMQIESLPGLLLDTTVYIDSLQDRFPREVDEVVTSTFSWHSTVTECEMAALLGLLDPDNPHTASVLDRVAVSIEQRPAHRILNPDREVWREAGMLAGTLARLQQYGKAEQRRALNDALLLLSAAKAGLAVLTRNVADFDLLMQLEPRGRAVFYEI
jgi:predicted nucleic acid-binding protein